MNTFTRLEQIISTLSHALELASVELKALTQSDGQQTPPKKAEVGQDNAHEIAADWPSAVKHIAATQADIKLRALQIVNEFDVSYNNKKILDFGCGNGSIADELSFYTDQVYAYDVIRWPTQSKRKIEIDIDEIKKHAPFDIIFAYDVIDHLVKDDPVVVLKLLNTLLCEGGKILLTAHPWTSRHGGHIYQQINKAYYHLYRTAEELEASHIEVMPNLKVNKPLATYERWIKQSSLVIQHKRIINQEIEPFLAGDILDKIIANTWNDIEKSQAMKILGIQYIHYILVK